MKDKVILKILLYIYKYNMYRYVVRDDIYKYNRI